MCRHLTSWGVSVYCSVQCGMLRDAGGGGARGASCCLAALSLRQITIVLTQLVLSGADTRTGTPHLISMRSGRDLGRQILEVYHHKLPGTVANNEAHLAL